jgi:hypothetical protein
MSSSISPSFTCEATARTPHIHLDSTNATLLLAGESYPEDVTAFYAALTHAITSYFEHNPVGEPDTGFAVSIKLTYFNSSSARALMEMLDLLDSAASTGRAISVDWYCDGDDDITREFAQDISSDVSHIAVVISDLEPEASS